MGVINVQGSPSFSIHSSEANLRKSRALRKPLCSIRNRVYCVQSSSVSVDESKNITMGDSFIRPHLRQLAAYQPILPFEVMIRLDLSLVLTVVLDWIYLLNRALFFFD